MIKKILCPTDFSDNSINALKYGIELNKVVNADLVLYHSYFTPVPATDIPVAMPSDFMAIEYAGESLKELKDRYQGLYPSMTFHTELSDGFVEVELEKVQKKVRADLLIIGAHGKTGIGNLLVGNTAQRLIRKSLCPVIIVPPNYKFKHMNKIVFAANYGADDFKNVYDLINFAKPFNAEIILLHIDHEKSNKDFDFSQLSGFMNQIREESKYENISIKLLEDSDVSEGLNLYLEMINADMLCISQRNRKLFNRLFDPGLTKRIIRHMIVPTMVYHTDID